MVKKIISPTLIVLILVFSLATFSAFLDIFGGRVPMGIKIEPAFINGLITLLGILVGFLTAIVVRKQPLPFWVNLMVLVNWGFLLFTATQVFRCALGLSPPIYAAAITMFSLILAHITSMVILALRLFFKKDE